jgi:undecaprenyl-diphosphatase
MLTYLDAVLLGLVQGVTELFPISSLGHSVILPHLLHSGFDLNDSQFVAFVVATHLATALVLFGFFWRDWLNIIGGTVRSVLTMKISLENPYERLGWLIAASTVPAGLLGLIFQKKFEHLFGNPTLVAGVLVLNGLVLFGAERLRKRSAEGKYDDKQIAHLSWMQAVGVGLMQCFALIPGFSRTGFSMTGGLMSGLSHDNAARYSFLLATPIIFSAAILKVPTLFANGAPILGQAIVGFIAAGIAAYVSVKFLMKHFETKTLTPFAWYCLVAGFVSLVLLMLGI